MNDDQDKFKEEAYKRIRAHIRQTFLKMYLKKMSAEQAAERVYSGGDVDLIDSMASYLTGYIGNDRVKLDEVLKNISQQSN